MTAFETQKPNVLLDVGIGSIILTLIFTVLAVLCWKFMTIPVFRKKLTGVADFMVRAFSVLLTCLMTYVSFIFIYCGIDSWIAWNREYDAYVNGECKIVEGVVEDFHPLPSGGHDSESFTVSGVKFAYASTPGSYSRLEYDKCMIHGGCITGNGMKVKIWYLGDGDTTHIMRIDILNP